MAYDCTTLKPSSKHINNSFSYFSIIFQCLCVSITSVRWQKRFASIFFTLRLICLLQNFATYSHKFSWKFHSKGNLDPAPLPSYAVAQIYITVLGDRNGEKTFSKILILNNHLRPLYFEPRINYGNIACIYTNECGEQCFFCFGNFLSFHFQT